VSPVERVERIPLIVHARPVYRLVRAFLVVYLRLWHRLRIEGREHLPREGGVLIVSNHQSFLDIPLVAVAAPRHVAYVARSTLASSRLVVFLMRESGSIFVRQSKADRAALEDMIAHLRKGDCVAVFPEGTRTRDGSLGVFRPGAAVAARRAGVPVVPVAIAGAFQAMPRGRLFPRPVRLTVRFGPPIPGGSEDALERAQATIAGMLTDSAPRDR
jgi:1-acyl-sn-glycerol-3-phosphate acyltransferase